MKKKISKVKILRILTNPEMGAFKNQKTPVIRFLEINFVPASDLLLHCGGICYVDQPTKTEEKVALTDTRTKQFEQFKPKVSY